MRILQIFHFVICLKNFSMQTLAIAISTYAISYASMK